MSKTLLVIQSHEGGKSQVDWSFPYYQVPGWDILGVTPIDSKHHWPVGIMPAHVGMSGYLNEQMIRRLISLIGFLLESERFKDYTDFCIIEYDGVFLRRPDPFTGGFRTRLGGGPLGGAKAKQFFHTPWHFDRQTATIVEREGRRLIENNEWELYSPDVFLGRIVDLTGIKWTEGNTFSVNGNDFHNRKAEAKKAVENGAFYVHGIRHKAELDWLLSIKPCSLSVH